MSLRDECATPFAKSLDSPGPVERYPDSKGLLRLLLDPEDVTTYSIASDAGHVGTPDSEGPATITECVWHSSATRIPITRIRRNGSERYSECQSRSDVTFEATRVFA